MTQQYYLGWHKIGFFKQFVYFHYATATCVTRAVALKQIETFSSVLLLLSVHIIFLGIMQIKKSHE